MCDTEYVLIKNYQNQFTLNSNIILNFKESEKVDSIKFLDVTINTTLSWEPLSQILRKNEESFRFTFLCFKISTSPSMILLYNALAYSKSVYFIEVWGNAPSTHFDKAFIIQKRLVCHIFKTPPNDHTAPLFHKTKILPVLHLYTHRICLIAQNIFHNKPPNEPPDPKRSSKINLPHPLPKATSTSCGQQKPHCSASEAWNSSPVPICEIRSTTLFKAALQQHLLDSLV